MALGFGPGIWNLPVSNLAVVQIKTVSRAQVRRIRLKCLRPISGRKRHSKIETKAVEFGRLADFYQTSSFGGRIYTFR